MREDDSLVHPEDSERLQARGPVSAGEIGERETFLSIILLISNLESEDSDIATIYDIGQ